MNHVNERITAMQSAIRRAQKVVGQTDDPAARTVQPVQRADSRTTEIIDYDRLAAAIASALNGTTVQMDGHAVGVLVTGTVSREIAREAKRRG